MPAATPHLYFQMFQHEVLQIISTLNTASHNRTLIIHVLAFFDEYQCVDLCSTVQFRIAR